VRSLTWPDVRWHRLRAHWLAQRASPNELVDVVAAVCGIHAQVAASAELSLAARIDDLRQEDVRRALWTDRVLIKTYGLRGTLHLFPSREVALWLAALRQNVPPRPGAREVLTAEQQTKLVNGMVAVLDGSQLTREELEAALAARLGRWVVEPKFQAFGGHMSPWQLALGQAALEGVLVSGPPRRNRVTYVRLDQWIGKLPAVDGWEAVREVCRRFVHAYGPTTRAELSRWLYMTPAAAQGLLDSLGDELELVEVEGWRAFALKDEFSGCRSRLPKHGAHLLPQFDCYVVGAHPRAQLIPSAAPAELQRGTAAPFAVVLVDGVVAGLWDRQRRGRTLTIRVDPFVRLSAAQGRALESEAERLAAFLGLEPALELARITPRAHM
jgi:Winged helix DNA-binding domain